MRFSLNFPSFAERHADQILCRLASGHFQNIAIGSNTIQSRGTGEARLRDGLNFIRCQAAVLTGLQTERLSYGSREAGAAITLQECTDFTIGHCQILDPQYRGIQLRDCRRCVVDGCTIIDRKKPPTMIEAISVVGGKDNHIERDFL